MKASKRFLSSILTIFMIFSVCSVGITAADVSLEEIVPEPIACPVVKFSCTEVTRVAKGVNSVEPGNVVVKSTPSGVPELSGLYVAQAYAGETPVATTITFTSPTIGVQIRGISCNNEGVVLSPISYSNGSYITTIESGIIEPNEDGTYNPLVFTVDYTWTDGNTYQEKCVSYVEGIATGGSYAGAYNEVYSMAGMGSIYRVHATALTRLLGKGVYYEQPAMLDTNEADPYKSYGVYNVATGTFIDKVAAGYNTSIMTDDETSKPIGNKDQEVNVFASNTAPAHIYVDSSVAGVLADQKIRLDAVVGELSDRNNDNPYVALADTWVSSGIDTSSDVTTNDAKAQAAVGLDIPAKANYGVTGHSKDTAIQTLTGGVGSFQNLFTQVLTGNVTDLIDNSTYTITLKYYSYMWVNDSYISKFNMTSTLTVPIIMIFHVVDKGELREKIDYVMNTEPETPTTSAHGKGDNPQSWYYKSGFAAFQTAYVNALDVLNNPRASQSDINEKTIALSNAYNSLELKYADYTQVNALKSEAQEIKKNASAYTADSIALIDKALAGVKTGYTILFQGTVDTMAKNLKAAIEIVKFKSADYSKIENALAEFEALEESDYVPSTWLAVENAFAEVEYGLPATEQEKVDAMADSIEEALANLKYRLADYSEVNKAIERVQSYVSSNYTVESYAALRNVIVGIDYTLDSSHQDIVDNYVVQIDKAIENLESLKPNKILLEIALSAELPKNTDCCDRLIFLEYQSLVAEATNMNNDSDLTILDQAKIDEMASDLTAKYNELLRSVIHTSGKVMLENNIPATCTATGSYDRVVYCSVCNEELSRTEVVVLARDHTWGDWIVTIEPTTTSTGLKVRYCESCITDYQEQTIPKLEEKYSLSGTAASFYSGTDEMLIVITRKGETEPLYSQTVTGISTEYMFEHIETGYYVMTVSKKNHVTRKYDIAMGNIDEILDIKLHLPGDTIGDGRINTVDVAIVNSHVKGVKTLNGYDLACADVNGDGKVNTIDVAKINAHAKGVTKLW